MKKFYAFLVLAGLCVTLLISSPVRSQGNRNKLRKNSHKIENNYIVVLDETVVGERGRFSIAPYIAAELAGTHRGSLKHVYQNALNGFAVEMSAEDAIAEVTASGLRGRGGAGFPAGIKWESGRKAPAHPIIA